MINWYLKKENILRYLYRKSLQIFQNYNFADHHENKLCEDFVPSFVCCCGVSLYELCQVGNPNSREAAPPSPAELLVTQRTSS